MIKGPGEKNLSAPVAGASDWRPQQSVHRLEKRACRQWDTSAAPPPHGELCLHGQRKIADLIQKKNPVFCQLESALLALICACALFMTKKFRLSERFRDSAAVSGYKWFLGPVAQLMDCPGDELLTSSSLSLHKNRQRRVGHLFYLLDNLLHSLIAIDKPPQRTLCDPGCLIQLTRSTLQRSLKFFGALF